MNTKRYDSNTREKAVRLVIDHLSDYPSKWAAIQAVSQRLGMTSETLRRWIRQFEIDAGNAPGLTTDAKAEIARLKRKNAELERTIEILGAATAFFARESDPQRG
jgi:transposase